jgi:hypothetical protein
LKTYFPHPQFFPHALGKLFEVGDSFADFFFPLYPAFPKFLSHFTPSSFFPSSPKGVKWEKDAASMKRLLHILKTNAKSTEPSGWGLGAGENEFFYHKINK